jgi:hypothetical protein
MDAPDCPQAIHVQRSDKVPSIDEYLAPQEPPETSQSIDEYFEGSLDIISNNLNLYAEGKTNQSEPLQNTILSLASAEVWLSSKCWNTIESNCVL